MLLVFSEMHMPRVHREDAAVAFLHQPWISTKTCDRLWVTHFSCLSYMLQMNGGSAGPVLAEWMVPWLTIDTFDRLCVTSHSLLMLILHAAGEQWRCWSCVG
jgi:hypothetical protein